MRQNKPFTVISYHKEDEKQHFRCKIHRVRLLEIARNGYYGPTYAATKAIYTTNPSQIYSSGFAKDVR